MKYTYIKDYKNDDKLRGSFNELTEKVYFFNFVQWYSNGFWREKYIPHSIADGEKVVANVSVNLMDFDMDGTRKNYLQIGTVMTDENYRGEGLSRYLIEKILEEYRDKVDGIYLFGNDNVLDFYPKFGFEKSMEYQYSKKIISKDNIKKIEKIDMSSKANWNSFFHAVKNSASNSRFTLYNLGLTAFWTTGPMRDCVYYLAEEDAYAIAEVCGDKLMLHEIIANHTVDLEKVIESFGSGINEVVLGFTPLKNNGYDIKEFHEEDCTLFILGEDLLNIQNKKLIFPTLSHA